MEGFVYHRTLQLQLIRLIRILVPLKWMPLYFPHTRSPSLSLCFDKESTLMILSFRTDRSGQTMQTQRSSLIRVYTVCHSIYIFWMHYFMIKQPRSNFRVITAIFRVSEYLGVLRYLCDSRSIKTNLSLYTWVTLVWTTVWNTNLGKVSPSYLVETAIGGDQYGCQVSNLSWLPWQLTYFHFHPTPGWLWYELKCEIGTWGKWVLLFDGNSNWKGPVWLPRE